jgi:DNA-binding NtrC family response regulator
MKLRPKVLLVDDDSGFCETACDGLLQEGYDARFANTGGEGVELFNTWHPDVVLLDQILPDSNGLELSRQFTQIDPGVKIIFITAYGSISDAVEAVKTGAYDYLTKPLDIEEFYLSVAKAFELIELERQQQIRSFQLSHTPSNDQLTGNSPALRRIDRLVSLAAQSDSTLLITGETGVGKGVVARAIHRLSDRGEELLTLNCSAIPETLIESELFGHEKGAFTGASNRRKGVFELAAGGSLLLDEIAEMPNRLQSKLLTVLEDRKIRRLGGSVEIPLNVRVIATTNRNLVEEIKQNRFREDLYYRLAVITIHVPPLRERPQDIRPLCRNLLHRLTDGAYTELPPEQLQVLESYHWPGNVRELRNVLERALILAGGGEPDPAVLIELVAAKSPAMMKDDEKPIRPLELVEREHIERALAISGDNKTKAAKMLGISLSTLRRRLSDYDGSNGS